MRGKGTHLMSMETLNRNGLGIEAIDDRVVDAIVYGRASQDSDHRRAAGGAAPWMAWRSSLLSCPIGPG